VTGLLEWRRGVGGGHGIEKGWDEGLGWGKIGATYSTRYSVTTPLGTGGASIVTLIVVFPTGRRMGSGCHSGAASPDRAVDALLTMQSTSATHARSVKVYLVKRAQQVGRQVSTCV
jgi:hypothetical protein